VSVPTAPDPFHTGALRAGVLASWAGSPTRFREDANSEEDLLLGGYADRWFVELAQNAADAAQRLEVPGRMLLRAIPADPDVDGDSTGRRGRRELRVANTGAPLDAAGVAALSSLRASAKRDSEAVGQFGVGFAAVLGVSSEPRIASSADGSLAGVLFSAERSAVEVTALGGTPAEELRRRGGRPPVLRLCWPLPAGEPGLPAGYHTEVRLPLLPEVVAEDLLSSAAESAVDLLLALPWLAEIAVELAGGVRRYTRSGAGQDASAGVVELSPGGERWLLARRAGRSAQDMGLGSGSAEERTDWSVCWALRLDDEGRPVPLTEDVLHAPTPSDERLALPARLFATFPMQPTRRRIRSGPRSDTIRTEAAGAYLDLVRALPPAQRIAVAPRPGFPLSELDSALHAAVTAALRKAPWLPPASSDGDELAPDDAVLLEHPGLTGPLADVLPGLLADSVAPAESGVPRAVLTALGVRMMSLAEVADRLAGLRRPPAWWRGLYAALAESVDAVPNARDELAALPVPLVDGRTVTGPRTTVSLADVGGGPADPAGSAVGALLDAAAEVDLPGLRIVHPRAAHPLLTRLGAAEAGPAELLDHPAVAESVARSVADAEAGADPRPLARLVLGLLDTLGEGARPSPGEGAARAWLNALALPDTEGEVYRADELRLPDAVIAPLLVPDAPLAVLAEQVVATYPRWVLRTAGVLDTFALLVDERPTGPDHDLADEELWWDAIGEPPARLVAVRDLDLVRDDAWPAALAVLAADPGYRAALRPPTPGAAGQPYTTWWLSRYARLGGRPPWCWRLSRATALAGLYESVPADGLDDELLAAIGIRRDLTVLDASGAADLLVRLGDPQLAPSAELAWQAHAALADAVLTGRLAPDEIDPPARLRAVDGSVVDARRAVLLDHPWLAPALPTGETVAGRWDSDGLDALAELLDLPLASEVVRGRVLDSGVEICWSRLPEVVSACAALGVPVPDGTLFSHEVLQVELTRPESRRVRVPVWRQDDRWHAADPLHALLAVRSQTQLIEFR
jgi:hypothetical protein